MRLYYTADYPHATVEIECAKCGRHGRIRTARLPPTRLLYNCGIRGDLRFGEEARYPNPFLES